MTVYTQAVSSVKWNAVSQGIKLGLYLLTSVLLARLLQPDDFGLLGMATVFTSLVAVFNDFGLGSAVVQKRDLDQWTLSSIFWVSFGIGAVTMVITILAAHAIGVFYQQPKLQPLLSFLSAGFLLTSLGQVQISLLIKRLAFKQIALIETGSNLLASLVAIAMAALNYGVWSLAAQLIITSGATTLLLWITSRWRPALIFRKNNLSGVLNYSGGLLGFNIMNYFSRNSDYLLIGKFLGADPLGQYTFAYRLMQFPLQNITNVVNRVLFPALSQVQNDDEQIQKGFIKASKWVALITFPIMVGILILAPELVTVIFGAKWKPAIPVIQIFALIGLIQSIIAMVGNIYTAKGRTDWLFRWGVVSSVIAVAGIAIGLRWGIVGVAVGYAIATLILVYPNFAIPFRLIHLKFTDYICKLKTQFILVAIMGLTVALAAVVERLLAAPDWFILFSNLIVGVAIYFYGVTRYDRTTFTEVMQAVFGGYATRILGYLRLTPTRVDGN